MIITIWDVRLKQFGAGTQSDVPESPHPRKGGLKENALEIEVANKNKIKFK